MAKPIFIIDIASRGFTSDQMNSYAKMIIKKLEDYHVFVNFDGTLEETRYRMFSGKEIEPIELEKLKEILNLK